MSKMYNGEEIVILKELIERKLFKISINQEGDK